MIKMAPKGRWETAAHKGEWYSGITIDLHSIDPISIIGSSTKEFFDMIS